MSIFNNGKDARSTIKNLLVVAQASCPFNNNLLVVEQASCLFNNNLLVVEQAEEPVQ
ncbi:hypothetical protein [Microcoleus sp. F4-D5]|uniref:hypothetical protein n=1 Tax=Microcoleus sp. F4-D5 TaxID=2818760 RepID=UPI002FD030D0